MEPSPARRDSSNQNSPQLDPATLQEKAAVEYPPGPGAWEELRRRAALDILRHSFNEGETRVLNALNEITLGSCVEWFSPWVGERSKLFEDLTGITSFGNICTHLERLVTKQVIVRKRGDHGFEYRIERDSRQWKVQERTAKKQMRQALLVAAHRSGQTLMHPLLEKELILALGAVAIEEDLKMEIQTSEEGRSEIQTSEEGRSEIQTSEEGRSEIQTSEDPRRSEIQTSTAEKETSGSGDSEIQTKSQMLPPQSGLSLTEMFEQAKKDFPDPGRSEIQTSLAELIAKAQPCTKAELSYKPADPDAKDDDPSDVFEKLRSFDNCNALKGRGRVREWCEIVERSPKKVASYIRMLERTRCVDKEGKPIRNRLAYLALVARDEDW
jgi:hypothetical protein